MRTLKLGRLSWRFGIACLGGLALLLPSAGKAETLTHLISSALQAHPAILVQQAQERGARAGVDSARWQFFPTPSIAIENARTGASDRSYPGDGSVSTLRLQQPLWTGGRLTAGVDKAEAEVGVSAASFEEVRQQLALRVVQSYGDWLAGHLKVQAYNTSMETHVRLQQQVQRRIDQGASSESDLMLAVGRLKSLAADLSVARTQQEIALARLGQLLGRRIDDATLGTVLAAPRAIEPRLQTLLDLAQAGSPAIQKAQAQAKALESVIAERRADLSPEVVLRAERQYGNFSYGNAAPENRLFIGISSRFGAGLSSQSNVEGARAQHQAALAEVAVQSRAVNEQVFADYALASSSDSRMAALGAALEAAAQVSTSYARQFLAGRKTWLDVMNAARELAQTEVQLADIQAAQVVVTWRLAIISDGLAAVVGGRQ